MILKNIKVIAFDADDTLWVNEPHYQDVEHHYCELLKNFQTESEISKELLKTEKQNILLYGFGAKGFMLSMIETAIKISENKVSAETIQRIIDIGKQLIEKQVELLDGIVSVLSALKGKYIIVLATKGDLLDQKRKLHKSGLFDYFDHIEIMSDKQEFDYKHLLNKLAIKPENFLMIGNSLKSDIVPVIAIGGQAVHIPYHITWQHEEVENYSSESYHKIEKISDLLNFIE